MPAEKNTKTEAAEYRVRIQSTLFFRIGIPSFASFFRFWPGEPWFIWLASVQPWALTEVDPAPGGKSSKRWRPGSGGSPRCAYRRFNQCGGGAASRSRCWAARACQRGMVVKAAGCAGQGILILAWLETRDHFNPFALRASEDFPVDVDRPT